MKVVLPAEPMVPVVEIVPDPADTEAKVAAPGPVTDHWASFKAKSDPVAAPMVIVPPAELPMVVLEVPVALMEVVPVKVNPPVP